MRPDRERALSLIRAGQLAAAKPLLEQVVAANGSDAEAWYLLGNLHGSSGDHERALACFEKASRLRPDVADVARNLGATLQILQRREEAIACYRRFLARAPGSPEIYYNLANALADGEAYAEAAACYRRALALRPGWEDACINLGHTLDDAGDLDGAVTVYGEAVAANPRSAVALRALGGALADQGDIEEALASYGRAESITPDQAAAVQAAMLLPVVPASLPDLQRWRERFESEVDRLQAKPPVLVDVELLRGLANFYLSYHGVDNRKLQAKVAALYLRACPSLTWTSPRCSEPRPSGARIRVGFISRHLFNHSIGKTTRGLLANLSRERFETLALFVPPVRDDAISGFIRANCDRTVILPTRLAEARRAIAELDLDVLFYQDVGMEPFTYFLSFSRLAPVQCVSFGHPDTTGIPNMDYFISNDLFEPADAQAHYTERLFQLHDLGTLAYYYRPPAPAPKQPGDFGLPDGARVYLCPQTLFKIHPSFDPVLGKILRSDPGARLVLIEGRSKKWSALLRARFNRAFADAAERVVFLPPQPAADFSSLVAACDVMLDTPHFNGMNTSLEAFAAGTPVVTMPTALQRGRHTAGMYRKMGLADCVAQTPDDYARIALRLAADADYRRHASEQIAARSAVLFEDRRVVAEFERFFAQAVGRR